MLVLNEHNIQCSELDINVRFHLSSESIAGQTANSERIEKGIRPSIFTVTCLIPFNRPAWLKAIRKLAIDTNEKNEYTTYKITNHTANALDVRSVQFFDDVSTTEVAQKKAWQVRFSLIEKHSVPEKREARNVDADNPADAREFSHFAKFLQKVAQKTSFESPQEKAVAKIKEKLSTDFIKEIVAKKIFVGGRSSSALEISQDAQSFVMNYVENQVNTNLKGWVESALQAQMLSERFQETVMDQVTDELKNEALQTFKHLK